MTNEKIDKALTVTKAIEIPADEPPPSLEQQLRGALYEASCYHWVTKITHQHRTAYIISEHILESLLPDSATPKAAQ